MKKSAVQTALFISTNADKPDLLVDETIRRGRGFDENRNVVHADVAG